MANRLTIIILGAALIVSIVASLGCGKAGPPEPTDPNSKKNAGKTDQASAKPME